MAVQSQQVPVGTPAPPFDLPTVDGGRVALSSLEDPALCVVFACNHCPYVRHVEAELGRLASEGEFAEVAFVAICPNDASAYPDDGPDGLRSQAERASWGFPYAIDADSSVARAYGAACTPDFFVYGPERTLTYRGAMDHASPGNDRANDGALLRDALRTTLAGGTVSEPHTPSMGCSIKWVSADG